MLKRDYIEYGLTEHCNLKCDGCTVFAPFLKPFFAELENYKRDVLEMAKAIHVKRFRLLGGEPMLHKQVIDFIQVAKDAGIARKGSPGRNMGVGVCSNGGLAHLMDEAFFKAIDFIDISVYPASKIDYIELKNLLNDKQQKYGFNIRFLGHKDEFQIVNLDTEIEDADKIQKIYDTCAMAHAWSCHHFYDGYYYKCAKPVYQNKYFDRRGIKTSIDYRKVDGIPIHEPDFEGRVKAYIDSKEPLASCKLCLGTSGPHFKGKQLSKEEIKAQIID